MKGDIKMSLKELSQVELMEKLNRREIKQRRVAQLMGLSVRQVKRKLHNYRLYGPKSLIHKARGKSSNNKIERSVLDQAIKIVRDKYWDFGPTLAYEKLVEDHNFKFSLTSLRKAMIEVGLLKPKSRKKAHIHQLRERRACFGELVQLDGSPHAWFEDRGLRCNLNVIVDDATGVPLLEFSKSETTQGYFSILEKYLMAYGKPLAVYSDKNSIFTINTQESLEYKKPSRQDKYDGLTQLGRALKKLDIELILANTPQAKGRVERLNQTLQDRLVKELRLEGISSIKEANQYLPKFIKKYIDRFKQQPRSRVDMHRKLDKGTNLETILCVEETRVLSKNLTFQFDNTIYQIKTSRSPYTLRHTSVVIRQRYDKTVTVWDYRSRQLDFSVINKKQTRTVHSKELNQILDEKLIEKARKDSKRKTPWETNLEDLTMDNYYYKPKGAV